MITKMTIGSTSTISAELNSAITKRQPEKDQMQHVVKEAKTMSEFYKSASALFSFLLQFPDHDIAKAYGAHFGEQPTIREVSKKVRTYNYLGCVITEEWKLGYNITWFDKDYEVIDATQVDEKPVKGKDAFIWDLFKEFGHERTKETRYEWEAVRLTDEG